MLKEDNEIDNYHAKYGYIDLNDVYFDDHPELGFDYLQYKLSKIKIWEAKKGQYKAIGGIQAYYTNNLVGNIITFGERKGPKVEENNMVEFNLKNNEYITSCSLWFEDKSILKLIFKTNFENIFEIGDSKGDEMIVDEFSKNKFLISLFGTYNDNFLSSIGFFINKKEEYFEYFIRGYIELKKIIDNEKKYNKIEEEIKNNKYDEKNLVLIKICKLPKTVFHEIIKFIKPL